MHPFALVCNSTIDETAAFYKEHDVKCAPLSYTIDGKTHEEDFGASLSYHDFYNLLRAGHMAQTSQTKPERYTEIFTEALNAGRDVLYVGFSSGLSGSYATGCMVARELAPQYPDRSILCVDSLCASGGEGLLLDKAVKLRDSGCTVQQAAAALEAIKLKIISLVTVDSLDHLWRGGRVSKASAVVGGLIGIKPMIYVDHEGKLQVFSKIRGRRKALDYLVTRCLAEITDRSTPVRISHGDCLEDAEYVAAQCRKAGLAVEIRIINTVIGSHTGPGVMTLFYIGSERKA
jgi:DegV family protein with EDD domain